MEAERNTKNAVEKINSVTIICSSQIDKSIIDIYNIYKSVDEKSRTWKIFREGSIGVSFLVGDV